jgi:hypothetical protein
MRCVQESGPETLWVPIVNLRQEEKQTKDGMGIILFSSSGNRTYPFGISGQNDYRGEFA